MNDLLKSVTEKLSGQFNELGLNTSQGTESVKIGVDTVKDKVTELVSGGSINNLNGVFTGDSSDVVESVKSNFSNNLQSKAGLSGGIADKLKEIIPPMIMEFVNDKTGGDFDLSKISSMLGMDSGIMDKIKDSIGGGLGDSIKEKLGSVGSLFGK